MIIFPLCNIHWLLGESMRNMQRSLQPLHNLKINCSEKNPKHAEVSFVGFLWQACCNLGSARSRGGKILTEATNYLLVMKRIYESAKSSPNRLMGWQGSRVRVKSGEVIPKRRGGCNSTLPSTNICRCLSIVWSNVYVSIRRGPHSLGKSSQLIWI